MIALPIMLGVLLFVKVCRAGLAGLVRLTTLHFRGGYLALLACLAQVIGLLMQQHRMGVLLTSATLLAAFCWLNRRHVGMRLIALGIGLNMMVMAVNGGSMPISPATVAQVHDRQVVSGTPLMFSKNRVLDDHEAALAWLGDRLVLPGTLAHLAAWSIGDIVLLMGVNRLLELR